MKNLIITTIISIVLFAFTSDSKEYFATVEEVSQIPVFFFSKPNAEYDVIGKAMSFSDMLKMASDQKSTVRQKAEKIVKIAQKRVKDKKISTFDALIIEIENDKVIAIKFKAKISKKAKIDKYGDLPIYFFCEPNEEYNLVKKLEADYSVRAARSGMLFDKIKSMVNRTIKKQEKNEIEHFDAIIINPDDLSEKLIVFNKTQLDK